MGGNDVRMAIRQLRTMACVQLTRLRRGMTRRLTANIVDSSVVRKWRSGGSSRFAEWTESRASRGGSFPRSLSCFTISRPHATSSSIHDNTTAKFEYPHLLTLVHGSRFYGGESHYLRWLLTTPKGPRERHARCRVRGALPQANRAGMKPTPRKNSPMAPSYRKLLGISEMSAVWRSTA